MRINLKKTKVVKVSREILPTMYMYIVTNGEQLEDVSEFTYLGSVLSEEGRCSKDIKMRIRMAKCAFNKGKELLTEGMSMNLQR